MADSTNWAGVAGQDRRSAMAASRLTVLQAEVARRQRTGERYGFLLPGWMDASHADTPAHLLIAAADNRERERLLQTLGDMASVTAPDDMAAAEAALLAATSAPPYDAAVLAMAPEAMCMLYKGAREADTPRATSVLFLTDSNDPTPLPSDGTDTMYRPWREADLRTRLSLLMGRARYDRAVRRTTQKAYAPVAIDILTGLYSHSFLHDHLTIQIADASHGGHSLSVGYFAIDGLDHVNQQCGYAAGDQLLHQVGLLVDHLTRTEDLAARYSGTNFCVTLFETDLAGASVMTNRLASIIGYTQFAVANLAEPVRVGIRVGISTLCPGDSAVALIARAAKDAGHPA